MLTAVWLHPEGPPRLAERFDSAAWPPDDGSRLWLDLQAPTDEEFAILEEPFGFHPLAIEDCLTPEHQPKVEDFGPYLFLIFRGIDFAAPEDELRTLKLAAFLGPGFLVTYHRAPLRSVGAIRDKYAAGGRARFRGLDYLLYEILDRMVEFYFPALETVDGEIEKIEEELFADPSDETLDRILAAKRRSLEIKRTLDPHREVFSRLGRGEYEEIDPATVTFYRDLYDSSYRLVEVADGYRDLLTGALDAYLSVVSQRLNEVMKVLTIFATIMLPLTFIAGVYGMNFEYMPELGWRYGYFAVWGVMLAVAGSLLWFFRRRGWL
ncbi:MAG: magnesium/cobalt transporter CorA [Gemmatimonadota bacterium]|nr:magnesium/cobalt transporter CorA [Gemmatimonadota bacterium]